MRIATIASLSAFAAGLLLAGAAQAQDLAAGEKSFAKCKACHTLEADGPNRVGPNLHNLFGRAAGTHEGFKYSDAMVKSDITWSEESLASYLKDPRGFIKGNRMAFAGIKDDKELANLIAYLKQATGS